MSTLASFAPPPTRNIAQGWVTLNGLLVRTPRGPSWLISYVPIQKLPACREFIFPRRTLTVSPLTGWPSNARPLAVQSRRSPVSRSVLSGLPSSPTGSTPATRALASSAASAALRGCASAELAEMKARTIATVSVVADRDMVDLRESNGDCRNVSKDEFNRGGDGVHAARAGCA